MKCLKYCTINKRSKGHVEGVRVVKHCTVLPIKDQRLCMSEVSKVVFVAFTQQYIQSNLTHVGGVESSSIYTIRAVMLCMLKVSKEV